MGYGYEYNLQLQNESKHNHPFRKRNYTVVGSLLQICCRYGWVKQSVEELILPSYHGCFLKLRRRQWLGLSLLYVAGILWLVSTYMYSK